MRLRTVMARAGGLTLIALALPGILDRAAAQDAAEAAPAVVVAPVRNEDLTRSGRFVGRVQAIQQVNLQARVEGYIEKVAFEEGSTVKAGQLLFSLDKGPYEAALAQAQASLKAAQAQLAGARAALEQADLSLERQKTLLKSNTVAQAVVDEAQAKRDESAAQVDAAQAQIAEADANIKTAELNLSYTDITSPIDGRIGKTNFTVGNLVSTSSGTLATVIQMDPIRIVFSMSDRQYIQVVEALKAPPGKADRGAFTPTLTLADGKAYPYPGRLSFIDNTVDPSTGTIAVYADFENPDYMLVAGQFVDVTVKAGDTQVTPVVPSAAVLRDKDGAYVLVVGKDDRAEIRRIETGQTAGADVAVTSGLAQGETVIVGGIQKVKPGQVVKPQQAASGS